MYKAEWIFCPCCGAKTKTKVMENTILENFPLFCPEVQTRNDHPSKTISYNSYQRARRTDAEPITRSQQAHGLSALFFLIIAALAYTTRPLKSAFAAQNGGFEILHFKPPFSF